MRGFLAVPGTVVALAVAAGAGACGSRTGLESSFTTSGAVDAGVIANACDAAVCGCGAAPGTVLWTASPGTEEVLTGPWAADAEGRTFFLDSASAYPKTYRLVALDRCGNVAWRSAPVATDYANDLTTSVLVSGDQVVVQWGAIDAFDVATGAHRWNVNVDAYAEDAGFGSIVNNDFAWLGPTAADANGTMYVAFATGTGGTQTLIVTSDGRLSVVANEPIGDSPIDLVLDGAGQIDTLYNSTSRGALVEGVSRSGALAFSESFACAQDFLGPLASGATFLLMQSAPCAITLQGEPSFTLATLDAPEPMSMAIDGAENVYVNLDSPGVASFDSNGAARWSALGTEYAPIGPFVLAGGEVLVVAATSTNLQGAGEAVALDGSTGSVRWRTALAAIGDVGVVTEASELVVLAGSEVTAIATGGPLAADAEWPAVHGGADQRRAARGE